MPTALKFPYLQTLITTLILFAMAMLIMMIVGTIFKIPVTTEENGIIEQTQLFLLLIAAGFALATIVATNLPLLKLAGTIFLCIALAAVIREIPSCTTDHQYGFCLPRLFKRILLGIIIVMALWATKTYYAPLKSHFRDLLTIQTLWPATALVALSFVGDFAEDQDKIHSSFLGISHGYQYVEEIIELFGCTLIISLAIYMYTKSNGMSKK